MTESEHLPRPTLRCLWDDLADTWAPGRVAQRLKEGRLPPVTFRLEELDHPALALARELLRPGEDRGLRRIGRLNDRIWLKVKKSGVRWRAATHLIEGRPWIGAAGWREQGSPDDFYRELEDKCEAAAKGLHQQKYSSDWMLPGDLDKARLHAEVEYRRQNVEPVERLRDLIDKATAAFQPAPR